MIEFINKIRNKFNVYDESNKKLEAKVISQYYLAKAKKEKPILLRDAIQQRRKKAKA